MKVYGFLLITFLLFSVTVYAQSNRPTPSPLKSSEQKKESPNKSNKHTYQKEHGTEESPFFVRSIAGPKSKEEADYETYERHTKPAYERWAVYITGFIALVTAVLSIFNVFLWLTTKKVAETAKQSADALPAIERAYVFVTVETEAFYLTQNKIVTPPKALVHIRNHGRTPAILVSLQIYAYLRETFHHEELPKVPPYSEIPPGIIIGSNKVYESSLPYSIDRKIYDDIINKTSWFMCEGLVEYRDVFGKIHETGFCWEFQEKEGRHGFYISNNDKLNYHT